MTRKYYNDTDPPNLQPNTVLQDRIPIMRAYFNSMQGYNVNDCDTLNDVKTKYPELFTDDTHRLAVHAAWNAAGAKLDD